MNNKREQEILVAAHKKAFGKDIPAHLKSGKHDEGSLLKGHAIEKKRDMAKKIEGNNWTAHHKGKDFDKRKVVSTSESRSGFGGRDNS